MLLAGLTAMIAGCTLLAFATHPAVAAVALVLIGVNFGVSWPGFNALIAAVVEGDLRQQYFGVNFALVNLGIGIGGIIGGFYVDVAFARDVHRDLPHRRRSRASSRWRCCSGRSATSAPSPSRPTMRRRSGGYREILRQPAVLWLTLLTFLAMFIGYGQMEAGFPAYARQVAEVSTRVIGLSFAVNTAVIVLLQFAVLKRISGRRRTRVMVVMALVWALSWLILGAAGLLPDSLAAAIGVLAFMGVFAFGETLLQPTVPAVYNDLASDHNRGRYNAINSAAFQGGAITGPIAAGLLLDQGLSEWYIAIMVVGCLGIGVLALALERRIPATRERRARARRRGHGTAELRPRLTPR